MQTKKYRKVCNRENWILLSKYFIKNVSKIIYEPILIKKNVWMLTLRRLTFYIKWSMNKAYYVNLSSSNNSSIILPLMLPQIVWEILSPIPNKRKGGSLFTLWMWRGKLRLSMILKLGFMWPLLCYGEVARFWKIFVSFDQIITLTYVLMDNFCPSFNVQ